MTYTSPVERGIRDDRDAVDMHDALIHQLEDVDKDHAPVTKKEFFGWLSYSWASDVYSVASIAVFIPMILESLAMEAGVDYYDHSLPCDQTKVNYKCAVEVLGVHIETTSWSFLNISLSVLLQALVYIGCGSLADHGTWRKKFMLIWGFIGAIATILMVFPRKETHWVAALLLLVSNIAYGASYVFFLAYIPVLTRWHPNYVRAKEAKRGEDELRKIEEDVGNKISTHAQAAGYASGIVILIITAALGFVLTNVDKTYILQIGTMLSGVWWLLFMFLPLKFLRSRPGPPLPEGERYWLYSWKRVYRTVKTFPRLKTLFLYLMTWFVLSDGFHTITQVSILFAKRYLAVDESSLLMLAILVPFVAIIGTYVWYYVQVKILKWKTRSMILLLSVFYCLLPLYGIIGFFSPTFGLRQQWEVWLCASWHGFFLGALGSYCRVLFAELVPKGRESEFFAFFEITDKGSAWIGPAVVALITNSYDMRYSFVFLFINMLLPIGLIYFVDVEKGKEEAMRFLELEMEEDYSEEKHRHQAKPV